MPAAISVMKLAQNRIIWLRVGVRPTEAAPAPGREIPAAGAVVRTSSRSGASAGLNQVALLCHCCIAPLL